MEIALSRTKDTVLIYSVRDKFTDLCTSFKRRKTNKPSLINPILRFLPTEYVTYDRTVFVCDNQSAIAQLKEVGFVIENGRAKFKESLYTMYWDEFKLEVEVVPQQKWTLLKKCVTLSNTTSYFNINVLCSIITD
jgi:hypothetical protein